MVFKLNDYPTISLVNPSVARPGALPVGTWDGHALTPTSLEEVTCPAAPRVCYTGWLKLKYPSSKFAISWQQHIILRPILQQLLSTNQ